MAGRGHAEVVEPQLSGLRSEGWVELSDGS